jgi:predicted ATP-dependent serine protease
MKKTTNKAAVKTTTKKTTVKKAAVKKTTKKTENSGNHRLAQTVEAGRFSDIKIPDALRTTLKTGWEYIDALFTGEGIRPSTCCMVTGLPGGGKTTISLQLANSLAELRGEWCADQDEA